jgi:hypothetical protein
MKKYFVNEDWEIETFDDKSDLFVLVIEQSLPTCSYVYKYDTSPETIQPDYANFVNQFKETEVDGPVRIHLIKVPNTPQVCSQMTCADSEHKGSTEEAIEAINNMLNRADCEILESWTKEPLTEKKHTRKRRKSRFGDDGTYLTFTTGYPELNDKFFNDRFGTSDLGGGEVSDGGTCDGGLGESLLEDADEERAPKPKRYIKRYYIRPQNIFCSKKSDILKALVQDVGDNNCSVYSLKSLADHDDVHLLQPSDIIYYYDDGILYDKNHVKVMDYDLNVKHEEERPHFDPDTASEEKFDKVYDDRLTEALTEDSGNSCIICGEKIEGYGNNPAPVSDKGECCDACNMKFVIPARLEAGKAEYEDN